jgi:streptogramin lyase
MIGYTSPSVPAVLYITALGGNSGAGSNTAIGLMSVAGLSNTLTQPVSITLNELTTVAAEWALAQFIDPTGQLMGAPSSNATGLANAANQAQMNLADVASGTPASFWSTYGVTQASCTGGSPPVNCDGLKRLDTIASILAACVESSGPSSSACATLLSNTGGSTTTLQAAHAMATNPVANVAALFALQGGAPPFTPALSAAPDGWEIALNFNPSGVIEEPEGVAIDVDGNAWIANEFGDSVTKLTPSGGLAGNFAPSGANFSGPAGVAIDGLGNVWVTNFSSASVTELTSMGGLVGNFSVGASGSGPVGVAIDPTGNVWVANEDASNVTKLTSGGGLTGIFAPVGANFSAPVSVAIDPTGNVWIANLHSSVTALTSNGDLFGNFATIGSIIFSANRLAIDPTGNIWITNGSGQGVIELNSIGGMVGNFVPSPIFNPFGIAMDAAGNAWITDSIENGVTELTSSGALAGSFVPGAGILSFPTATAIDASGNVWVTSVSADVAELVGLARPVLTPLVACLKKSPPHAVCLP